MITKTYKLDQLDTTLLQNKPKNTKLVILLGYTTNQYPRNRTTTCDNQKITTTQELEHAIKEIKEYLLTKKAHNCILYFGFYENKKDIEKWIEEKSTDYMQECFKKDIPFPISRSQVQQSMEYTTVINKQRIID